LISAPAQAASTVQGILGWLKNSADAILTFVKTLFA
jgi:hypothetical protein